MAKATTITGGFVINAKAVEPDPDEVSTPEEELARRILTLLRQGFPKAALAACTELSLSIAHGYEL